MSRTVFKSMTGLACAALLSGCGLYQSVSDVTASTARAVFYKQVKTLHLDFSARAALNTDLTDMSALSVPTLIRVYQLRDSKAAGQAGYEHLLGDDDAVLGPALLGKHSLVVKPGAGAQLNVPLLEEARFVAVVALFRSPDTQAGTWRLIVPRADLEPDRARVIELGDNRLTLRPLARD